ncbi:hypothetical protein ACFOG5_17110 [Pedobacter fastidiosus]|uniref:Outer membrane protein beta-barrel family protein n=1 Tax=Pedobacter fastidiosus TaxID=2765361 RepID=A0ABR7KSI1_9SPHI|nr:hypothetical protein [Pedobacter fastidiosus]MBC6110693.1 hypothetical protein [Pedobacter fastidiosus]
MNALFKSICVPIFFLLWAGTVSAQSPGPLKIDRAHIEDSLSAKVDTMGKTVLLRVREVGKKSGERLAQSGIGMLFAKDSLNREKKIILRDFSIENSLQYIRTQDPLGGKNLLNNLTVNGQLKMYRIPIDLAIANNYNAVRSLRGGENNLFKFEVPRPSFAGVFGADMEKYKNLRATVLGGKNIETVLRDKISAKATAIAGKRLTETPSLSALLNDREAVKNLLAMDEKTVRARIDRAFLNIKSEVADKGAQLRQSVSDSLNNNIAFQKDQLVKEITALKQELSDNGLDAEKIAFFQKIAENKITQKELESFFVRELGKNPRFSWLQRSYSRLSELQAGNFSGQLPGSFLNRDLFLNGVNFSLGTSRGPVRAGISTNRDLGSSKDAGFDNSTFSVPKMYTYISIPTTNFSFGSGKLSWVGAYDRQFSGSLSQTLNALPRNNLVFSVSQSLSLKKAGMLNLDISKSSTQYRDLASLGPDQLLLDKNTNGNYFRDDFLQTMSLGINHALDSKKAGIKSMVYMNYSGAGFQNPGQQGLGNLNMRFGANIKKILFRNLLTISLRSDFKNMPISAVDDAHWKNYNVQLDSRLRISKRSTVSLKYIENGVDRVSSSSVPVYASRKMQADLNSSYKLFGLNSFSHMGLASQRMSNPLLAGSSELLQFNCVQTVVFANFSLNGNLFYNRETSAVPVLGNMLSSDLSVQYRLFGSVSMSTGATYLNNENLARQAGIRQSVQFMLKKHFDITGYADLRKNMVVPLYPDLYSTARAEFSIHYYLDRQ